MKPVRPFTDREVADWRAQIVALAPAPPDEKDIDEARQVTAVSITSLTNGCALRVAALGQSDLDLMLNPVVARQIVRMILTVGQDHGWLDGRAEVTIPVIEADA